MGKTTRDAYGPYLSHAPVAAFNSICERCFDRYHELTDAIDKGSLSPRQHIILRMIYVAESTSYAARLTASWAASLPAMSLCRDRYEQVVRFSYLVHQDDDAEWNKFLVDFFRKKNLLGRRLAASPAMKQNYEKLAGAMDTWETETPTPEQRRYLSRWNNLSVEVCAEKRDAAAKNNERLPKFLREPLRPLYESMYAQASSVTHYDFYSLTMLDLHRAPDGEVVLAPDPWWPAFLNLHCALFDIVQGVECLWRYFGVEDFTYFADLHEEWNSDCQKMGIFD